MVVIFLAIVVFFTIVGLALFGKRTKQDSCNSNLSDTDISSISMESQIEGTAEHAMYNY